MFVQELYNPVVIGANSTYNLPDGLRTLAGLICTASGSLTIVNQYGETILNAFPVTAGVYHPLPINLGNGRGGSITTASGAAGTLVFS